MSAFVINFNFAIKLLKVKMYSNFLLYLITDSKTNFIINFNIFFIIQVENVRMIDRYNSKNSIVGTLYLTATHLIFVDPEANKETWVSTDI